MTRWRVTCWTTGPLRGCVLNWTDSRRCRRPASMAARLWPNCCRSAGRGTCLRCARPSGSAGCRFSRKSGKPRVFLGAQLGGDVLAVRHMQQSGHLVDGVVLVGIQVAVGIGHLPHGLDEMDLLLVREVVVERAGEAVVVIRRMGRGRGQF